MLECKASQVQLASFTWIYKWRLQQEHEMKARNGGIGMDDDIVHRSAHLCIPFRIRWKRDRQPASSTDLYLAMSSSEMA